MKRKKPMQNFGLMVEGQGSVYRPPKPVAESCGSNPFGPNVKHPAATIIENWKCATDRYSTGALYNLRKLKEYPAATVKRVIQETCVGSDLAEIRKALIELGLAKPSKSDEKTDLHENRADITETEDSPEQLLREAVLHVPPCREDLRRRIELFLART